MCSLAFQCRSVSNIFILSPTGLVHWGLSLPIWAPLSRLAFSIGMLQFVAIEYLYASTRVALNFDLISMGIAFLASLLFTFVLANVVFVVFEGPLMALMKKNKNYADYKRRVGVRGDALSKKVD